MARNEDQVRQQQGDRNDGSDACEPRTVECDTTENCDGQAFCRAVPDELLVSLDAKKHGLHATLSSRRAHSESEQDKKAVSRSILTTHPERQHLTAEYEEKSRHRGQYEACALSAHLTN